MMEHSIIVLLYCNFVCKECLFNN